MENTIHERKLKINVVFYKKYFYHFESYFPLLISFYLDNCFHSGIILLPEEQNENH